MKVNIRKGTREDLPQVLKLIQELATFEKAPNEVSNTLADMELDGFGEKPVFGLHVAESEIGIIGIAIYFIKYSTWKGKGLFLDDLIVTEKFRGQGIGRKLFNAYLNEAKLMGAKQAHWQVLDWNTPAIDFYKSVNASIEAEWLDCKLTAAQISTY